MITFKQKHAQSNCGRIHQAPKALGWSYVCPKHHVHSPIKQGYSPLRQLNIQTQINPHTPIYK